MLGLNKILSSICLMIFIALSALSTSLIASYCTGEWHWFGRSGAIVTMTGVILSVRPVLRKSYHEWLKNQNEFDCGTIEGTSAQEIEGDRQTRLDLIASYSGIILTILGTLIWGYGDLIN